MDGDKKLIPIEEIRAMRERGLITPNGEVADLVDKSFADYVNGKDADKNDQIDESNKRRFKKKLKRREKVEDDYDTTNVYQARYDRETWYYKRHKDTIDKYTKKEEKRVKNDPNTASIVVEDPNKEEIARIGMFKMWSIVWFDLIIVTILFSYIICSPIHLLKKITELFYQMKKGIAITVLIITAVIIVSVGLIFGVNAILNYARSLS